MKLYIVFLVLFTTTVQAQLIGDTENGLASYYSREYDGAETAYGLTYDRNAMVAAHKTFPVNSTVEVRNLDNGKSVRVKIIDKGPFIRGRVIEVSERAADLLGILGKVTVPVELKLVALAPTTPPQRSSSKPEPTSLAPAAPAPSVRTEADRMPPSTPDPQPDRSVRPPVVSPAVESNPKSVTAIPETPNPAPASAPKKVARVNDAATPKVTQEPALPAKTAELVMATSFEPGVYRINITKKPAGNYGVQMASYRDLEAAMDKVAFLQAKWFKDILIERVKVTNGSVYKVLLGPFESQASAERYTKSLKSRYKMDGFVVELKQ